MTAADWKHLAGFLMLAVPAVMLLTHIVAWIGRRRKPAPRAPGPMKYGYDSLAEFRKDAEELSVGDLLERAGGLGAPRNKELEERRKRKRDAERAEEEPVSAFHPVDARPGGWYRRTAGDLVVLIDLECQQGFGRFMEYGHPELVVLPFSSLGRPFPASGEWWFYRECTRHPGVTGEAGPFLAEKGDTCVEYPGMAAERVVCGCLAPSNFGRAYLRDADREAALNHGLSGVPGISGVPAEHCPDCCGIGSRKLPGGNIMTCTTCKGSGRKAQPSASAGR